MSSIWEVREFFVLFDGGAGLEMYTEVNFWRSDAIQSDGNGDGNCDAVNATNK